MDWLTIAAVDPSPATIWETFLASTIGGFALVVSLIAVVLTLLPHNQRHLAILPIVFLFLDAFLLGLSSLFSGIGMEQLFRFVAELLLFAAVGRTCFLLVVTVLRRVLRWSPQKIYLDVSMAAIYVMLLVPVLSKTGLKTSDLVTGTTVITGVTILAMQGTLGNIFAGIAIHIHHPFDIGDWIQFDDNRDHIGKVKEISWRATTVVTLDAVEVVIPNTKLAEMPLTNFMRPERHCRRSVAFVCPYAIPTARIHTIVLNGIASANGVLETPAPTVVTNAFTDRGIEYLLRFFIEQLDLRDVVEGGVRDRVWYSLEREGITICPTAYSKAEFLDKSQEARKAIEQSRLELHDKILRRISLCQGLPESAFAILVRESQMRMYLPNEVIIRQSDPGSELFIISNGSVIVSAAQPNDVAVEVTRLGPGDFFGEMSVLMGDPRSSNVLAASECELLVIGKHAFALAFAESPKATETVSQMIAARRMELNSRLAQESPHGLRDHESKSLLVKIQKYFELT